MLLKITLSEAVKIIQDWAYKNMPDSVGQIDIEVIAPQQQPVVQNFVPLSANAIFEFAGRAGERKIAAIKLLREATPGLGLGEAKKIVEAIMKEGLDNYSACNSLKARRGWLEVWGKYFNQVPF